MDSIRESDAARVLTGLFVKKNPVSAQRTVTEDGVRLPLSPPESPDTDMEANDRKRSAEASSPDSESAPVDDATKYKLKRARNNEAVRKCRIKKKQERESKQLHLQRLEATVMQLTRQNAMLQGQILMQADEILRLKSHRVIIHDAVHPQHMSTLIPVRTITSQ